MLSTFFSLRFVCWGIGCARWCNAWLILSIPCTLLDQIAKKHANCLGWAVTYGVEKEAKGRKFKRAKTTEGTP